MEDTPADSASSESSRKRRRPCFTIVDGELRGKLCEFRFCRELTRALCEFGFCGSLVLHAPRRPRLCSAGRVRPVECVRVLELLLSGWCASRPSVPGSCQDPIAVPPEAPSARALLSAVRALSQSTTTSRHPPNSVPSKQNWLKTRSTPFTTRGHVTWSATYSKDLTQHECTTVLVPDSTEPTPRWQQVKIRRYLHGPKWLRRFF